MPTDDFTNNTSTAGSLNVNNSVAGKIESIDDTDWFKVPLIADTTYQIDLQGSDSDALQNPYLKRIYDANGLLILDNQDQESPLIFTPTTSGDYYIEAGATDDATGSYLLSIIDNPELVSPEVGTVDTQGPTLIDFSISSTVDVSSGSAPLELSVEALDDNSGIDQALIYFSDDLSYSYSALGSVPNTTTHFIGLFGAYDSWDDNIATESKNIFDYSMPGIYTVEKVILTDNAGNDNTYTTSELVELGFNTEFELIGSNIDLQAPTLVNFSMSSSVDVSSGSAPLELSVEALDDNSGINQALIYFSDDLSYSYSALGSVPNTTTHFIGLFGAYDSWNDNIATESKNLFDYSTPGIYTIEEVILTDNAANNNIYTTSELSSLGYETSFWLTDSSLPESNDYSFSFIETEDGVEIELYGPSSITGDTNIELKIEYSSDDLEFGGINFSDSNEALRRFMWIYLIEPVLLSGCQSGKSY